MNFKKKNLLMTLAIVFVLIGAFWWGGNSPGLQGVKINSNQTEVSEETNYDHHTNEEEADTHNETVSINEKTETELAGEKINQIPVDTKKEEQDSTKQEIISQGNSETDEYLTESIPEGKPSPIEPENVVISDHEMTCELSIRCDSIFENMDWLDSEKKELIPSDGIIYPQQEVVFYEGESVFNVLLREMKQNKIHLEYVNTPMYNSAYIEGINNIYEFDCGELSGWMYQVNGWSPNYGSSRYQLQDGDLIEWIYTCDLGEDMGNGLVLESENE